MKFPKLVLELTDIRKQSWSKNGKSGVMTLLKFFNADVRDSQEFTCPDSIDPTQLVIGKFYDVVVDYRGKYNDLYITLSDTIPSSK